jgi:hypothetical protein
MNQNKATNSASSASKRSHFEKTINLKENSFNFGIIIFRKCCADCLASNRYSPLNPPAKPTHQEKFAPLK